MLVHRAPAITERLNMKMIMKNKLEAIVTVLELQMGQLETLIDAQQEFIDDCPDSRSEEKQEEADALLESLTEAKDVCEAARDAAQACLD